MRTIEQKLTAVNNAEYDKNHTNKYVEAYKSRTLEILNNPKTTFSEFIEEQSMATDIARLGWLKSWAMLKEQLSMLWLHNKSNQKPINNVEQKENSIFWAPNKTVVLSWLAA